MKKILSVAAILLLNACAAIKLEPGADKVIVTTKAPSKKCKYVGHVVGNQGNFFTGAWTSNRDLEEGAMNDLRNQARRKGANYVHLITNRAGKTGTQGGHYQQTNITNSGNAYRCPKK